MDRIPLMSIDLIDQLDKQIPEQCPEIKTDERMIWFYAGQRQVVRMLKSRVKHQEESSLGGLHE
jgi:hypothetical protein